MKKRILAMLLCAPNTTYHVRAYGINAIDMAYGKDVVFTTQTEGSSTSEEKLMTDTQGANQFKIMRTEVFPFP